MGITICQPNHCSHLLEVEPLRFPLIEVRHPHNQSQRDFSIGDGDGFLALLVHNEEPSFLRRDKRPFRMCTPPEVPSSL